MGCFGWEREGRGLGVGLGRDLGRGLEQGPEQLEPAHKQLLAADAQSLRWLHEQVWLSAADSPWGKRLANRIAH